MKQNTCDTLATPHEILHLSRAIFKKFLDLFNLEKGLKGLCCVYLNLSFRYWKLVKFWLENSSQNIAYKLVFKTMKKRLKKKFQNFLKRFSKPEFCVSNAKPWPNITSRVTLVKWKVNRYEPGICLSSCG